MSQGPLLQLDRVSKCYRLGTRHPSLAQILWPQRWAAAHWDDHSRSVLWSLRELSLEVVPGEALGLIGPNGAGKSTVLKLLAGITQPSMGRVTVGGRVSALIELGAGFHHELSGRDNIQLYGALLGMRRQEIRARFDEIVSFSGLEDFIDTPVKRYSSGMFVRLGFAVAAHVDPEVLLVDEVLAVGDAQFRQRCAERIEVLRKQGTTIVFVAHNLYLVQSVCDRAIFIESGQARAEGATEPVIQAYETWLRRKGRGAIVSGPEQGASADRGQRMEIVSVALLLKGQPAREFDSNDTVVLQVRYCCELPLREPNLVLRFMRSDGVICAMIRTRERFGTLPDLYGSGSIELSIDPIQLSSGSYLLNARLTGAIDGVVLATGDSPWFEVRRRGLGASGEGVFEARALEIRVRPERDEVEGNEQPTRRG